MKGVGAVSKTAAETWVPEDHIYDSADKCLKEHPDQAAARVFSHGEMLKLMDKLLKAHKMLREIMTELER